MPNTTRTKKKGGGQRRQKGQQHAPRARKVDFATQRLSVAREPEPEYYREPMEERPVPDMSAQQRPEDLSDQLSAFRFREPDNQTPTSKRFTEAYKMTDNLSARYKIVGAFLGLGDEVDYRPMSFFTGADTVMLKHCIMLLRAVTLTDFRVGVSAAIVKYMSYPSCLSSITELHLSGSETQLSNVGAKEFVVLLAAAARLAMAGGRMVRMAVNIVHELRTHATDNYPCLDWDDLYDVEGVASPMTKEEVRFALATVGIKATRMLFRSGNDALMDERLGRVRSRHLLDSIEAFANDQVEFRPSCAVGYFNLGWVAQQSVRQRGVDGLAASADCLMMMSKCYKTADAEGDDFLRAAGRIEAAMCLSLGAGGIVGLLDGAGSLVERDMRTEKHKTVDWGRKPQDTSDVGTASFFKVVARADTPEMEIALLERERKRFVDGISPTTLEADETLLVAPWDVLRLWNEAMEPFDALSRWGHSHVVYGETSGWDQVVMFLKFNEDLAVGQYASAPVHHGFRAHKDKGYSHTLKTNCAWCGGIGSCNQRCSRCKEVYYCSAECQRKHWKKGHKSKCKMA